MKDLSFLLRGSFLDSFDLLGLVGLFWCGVRLCLCLCWSGLGRGGLSRGGLGLFFVVASVGFPLLDVLGKDLVVLGLVVLGLLVAGELFPLLKLLSPEALFGDESLDLG